jgi:hypothetical protein
MRTAQLTGGKEPLWNVNGTPRMVRQKTTLRLSHFTLGAHEQRPQASFISIQ